MFIECLSPSCRGLKLISGCRCLNPATQSKPAISVSLLKLFGMPFFSARLYAKERRSKIVMPKERTSRSNMCRTNSASCSSVKTGRYFPSTFLLPLASIVRDIIKININIIIIQTGLLQSNHGHFARSYAISKNRSSPTSTETYTVD